MKNKYTTIGIILTTLILAGVAIFTATRLYQTRTQPVAPNAPSSKPAAAGTMCGGIAGVKCPTGEVCVYTDGKSMAPFPDASGTCQVSADKSSADLMCSLSFSLATATPSPSPTPTATPTKSPSPTPTPTPTKSPSPSPTASPVPQCNTSCTSSSQCLSGMTCYIPNGSTAGNCRKTSCLTESDCVCATATPSPTPTSSPTQSPTPSPTASPVAQCNSVCTSNSNCPSSMICYIPSGSTAGNCRNTQCLSETDCTCTVVTSAPTTTPTYLAEVPATSAPSLPDAGTSWPTIMGTGFGILVIIASLFLAL